MNGIKVGIVGEGCQVELLISKLLTHKFYINTLKDQSGIHSSGDIYYCGSLKEIAKTSAITITVCADGPELEKALFTDNGLIAGISYDGMIVDMSSVSPELIQEISEQMIEKNVPFLDAAIINEVDSDSELIQMILIGGEERAFETVEPVFKRIAEHVKHIGTNGASKFYRQAFGVRKKT